jgi:hypothetical protein
MTRSLILLAAVAAYAADPAGLQVRVIEGEGTAYPAGSRATRGITVQVIDQAGQPVEGAAVSFSLPTDGPGGAFASGSRNEVAVTHSDGRAAVWGMQWNKNVGSFGILISAAKGQERASVVCAQSLTDAPARDRGKPSVAGGGHKWLWITLAVVGGAAGAGVAAAGGGGQQSTTPATTATGVQIGTPSISLGHP